MKANNRTYVQAIITIAFFVWAIILLLEGNSVSLSWLKPYSIVVFIVYILVQLFDKYLWRILPFALLISTPIIYGTWKGEIRSKWIDPKTKKKIKPITTYICVQQTFTEYKLTLMTEQSKSQSTVANLIRESDGSYNFSSVYVNVPKHKYQKTSPIHSGLLSLYLTDGGNKLEGNYWTSRETAGEIILSARVKKRALDYSSAIRLFE